jgi:hypothetical protein
MNQDGMVKLNSEFGKNQMTRMSMRMVEAQISLASSLLSEPWPTFLGENIG